MIEKAVFIRRGKAVGTIKGDVFYKKLSSRRHFLRKPPAISFDEESLKKAFNYGAKKIVIYDKDTKKNYTANFETVYEKGFKVGRGFGKQIALPLSFWNVEEDAQETLAFS